jgi:hypothetical protein
MAYEAMFATTSKHTLYLDACKTFMNLEKTTYNLEQRQYHARL